MCINVFSWSNTLEHIARINNPKIRNPQKSKNCLIFLADFLKNPKSTPNFRRIARLNIYCIRLAAEYFHVKLEADELRRCKEELMQQLVYAETETITPGKESSYY